MSTTNVLAGHAQSEAGSPAAGAAISTNAIRDTHSGAGRRLRSADEVEAVAADEALGTMMDIMQPFFAHLSRTWTIRDLVKLERINKTWEFMVADHRMLTTAARGEDETNDWYFPLKFLRDPAKADARRSWIHWDSFSWTGLHHPSNEFQRLPPLPTFPLDSPLHFPRAYPDHYPGHPHGSCLIASSGGLLLFTDKIRTNLWRYQWRPLMVFNPLTKAWRILPAVNPQDVGMNLWSYHKVHGHLVVDEKANKYEVILVGHSFVCVYESATKFWTSRVYPQSLSIGPRLRPGFDDNRAWAAREGLCDVPSVTVGGKIYYSELEIDGDSLPIARTDAEIRSQGHVRVVEVDAEAGTWKEHGRYALRTYFPDGQAPAGFVEGSFRMKIVECMGGMYAIIPAKLDITEAMDDHTKYATKGYLPLQFHVLQLRGSGLTCGRVLTQNSEPTFTWIDFEESHNCDMFGCSVSRFYQCYSCRGGGPNWYRCIGRGRTIWFMEYYLHVWPYAI